MRARHEAFLLLSDLPAYLYYHSALHTIHEVVPAAAELAEVAQISEQERNLLVTAAWYHDVGFIEQHDNHEVASARIAQTILPGCGYTSDEVACITALIDATRMPQQPGSGLEAILCDADLYVLGAESPMFLVRNTDLRFEQAMCGIVWSDQDWYAAQLSFLEQHAYHTMGARRLRDHRKHLNSCLLRERMHSCVRSVG